MIAGELLTQLCDDIEKRLQPPIDVSDCRAIFDEIKPKLAPGGTLDVQLRGLGTDRDPAPFYIEVIVDARTDHSMRRRISVST